MGKRALWTVAALAVIAAAVWRWGLPADHDAAPRPVAGEEAPVVPGRLPPLGVMLPASEASGLAASHHYPGVFYWLRDGGPSKPDTPRDAIWAMRIGAGGVPEPVRDGQLFPSYAVAGATNHDWEALTVDDAGALWIGELGANDCKAQQRLLQVAEPEPGGFGAVEVVADYDLRFPDNPKPGCRTYNSEALLWLDGHLYVFAKTRGTPVYRVDLPPGARGTATLTRIGEFGAGVDNISAASVSDDRSRLMVLDHERLRVFTTDPTAVGDDFLAGAAESEPTGTARFEAPGGASVEGGTFVPGGHDIAFVAEDRHLYYARPASYGEPAPSPSAVPSGTTPTPTPTGWDDPALDVLPTLAPGAGDVG